MYILALLSDYQKPKNYYYFLDRQINLTQSDPPN